MPTAVSRFSQLPLPVLVFLFASTAASAQSGEESGLRARIHGGFSPSTEFDNNVPAEVTVYRAGLDLEYDLDLGSDAAFTIGAGSEVGTYDFDAFGAVPAGTGGAFAHYAIGSIYGNYHRALDQETDLYFQGRILSGMDVGAKVEDTFHFGLVAGATQVIDEDLTIGVGLGVMTRLEEDLVLYPVPLVEWRIDDQWRLSTGHVTANASGFEDLAGVRLYHATNETTDCYLGLGWQLRQYRMDDDPSDAYPEGAVVDNRLSLYGGAVWKVQHNTVVHLNLGYHLRQEFDAHNVSGPNPADLQTDPAPFVGVGLEYRF